MKSSVFSRFLRRVVETALIVSWQKAILILRHDLRCVVSKIAQTYATIRKVISFALSMNEK